MLTTINRVWDSFFRGTRELHESSPISDTLNVHYSIGMDVEIAALIGPLSRPIFLLPRPHPPSSLVKLFRRSGPR